MLDNIKKDDKGLVGIGTLIIFISMIIVVSVAAGVLINTGQSLQEQARSTGEETIREISSGIQINAIKGDTTDGEDPEIDKLEVIAQTYSGSPGINLEDTVVQIMTSNSMEHLGEEDFEVEKIENVSGTEESLLGPGDTVSFLIDLEDIEELDPLEEGASASLTFMPPEGFETYYGFSVPRVLREDRWYEL